WSESKFVVLLRRELAAYFYSPIAYVVVLGMAIVAWYHYLNFLDMILVYSAPARPLSADEDRLLEPIVWQYVRGILTYIALSLLVPVVTMRLLSEERRTGTLEVLFTAPVKEVTVVLAKFFATFIMFLIAWVPWFLFLVSLRVEGGRPFDFRPLLSFFLALGVTGASFVSMGLFFSSLTRNQIAAAVLTFVGIMVMTVIAFFKQAADPNTTLNTVLSYVSYIDLWSWSLKGLVIPSNLF